MSLKLVERECVPCWPWNLRDGREPGGHPVGAACELCGRDVALPRTFVGYVPICVYCGFDIGLVPAEDVPPDAPPLWERRRRVEKWLEDPQQIASEILAKWKHD